MKKKIIAFSVPCEFAQQVAVNNPVREFAEGDVKGYEVDQVIFSTAFNRNRCYFQVSKLLGYAEKLGKILSNIDHDLSQTGGKYVPANEAGYSKIWSVINNGELEIWGTFRATHPTFVARRNEFSAPSVELMVDDRTAIVNENGEYYEDFEWVATAQLAGILAGSGDARNASDVREFNLDLTPINNQSIMNEEQVKALLDEQKKEFDAQLEAVKKEFKTVAQSGSQSAGVYEYVDENGNKYRTTYEEMYKSVTELLESDTVNEGNAFITAMKLKGYNITPATPDEAGDEGNDTPPVDPAVDEAERQVNNALNAGKQFAQVPSAESQLDPEEGAGSDVRHTNAKLTAFNKLSGK